MPVVSSQKQRVMVGKINAKKPASSRPKAKRSCGSSAKRGCK